jgi:predicted ribosome quality control (RQC) complex YloA/Tae2 family protein
MAIRWDALLVHHLALELDATLAGCRLRAVRFDGERRDVVLFFKELTLEWCLHPVRGYPLLHAATEPNESALKLPYRLRRVRAPADERLIIFELMPVRGRQRAKDLVVELLGNQWNCLVIEHADRIARHVLHTRSGKRVLRVGQSYSFPDPSERAGVDSVPPDVAWQGVRAISEPPDRRRALISQIAWTSPINAEALLNESEAADAVVGGLELWSSWTAKGVEPAPVLLALPSGPQPYPFPIPGVTSVTVDSLIEAFQQAAGATQEPEELQLASVDPRRLARLEQVVVRAERRLARLKAEFDELDDADRLRGLGNLILANHGAISAGAERVSLTDFEGDAVVIELDPDSPPHVNAAKYYDKAAKIKRARERLPGLEHDARTKCAALRTLLDRANQGDATAEEVDSALPAIVVGSSDKGEERALPYRRFLSAGGLEIRVGRGARHNDDLTFHHSAPNDMWRHARHASGAHVILRWPGPGNPPARDLEQAATLAAVHSKARTSGSAPVDWTLRKYVRKPKGAPPGTVLPERVKTIFVTPREELVTELAD